MRAIGRTSASARRRLALALIGSLVVAGSAVLPVLAATTPPTWTTVQASADGYDPAIAIDATGRRHVVMATHATGIVYLTTTSGAWTRSVIGAAGDRTPALAVDGQRKVHVAFSRSSGAEPGIYYATNRTGSWKTTRLSTVADDAEPSIAVDALGEAHVAWQRAAFPADGAGIGYATNRRGFWRSQRLTTTLAGTPSIALDADRRVHIVFRRTSSASWSGLSELTDAGGVSWATKPVTTNVYDANPSLTVAPSGALGLAFVRGDPAGPVVVLATRTSGAWSMTKYAAGGLSVSLRFDAAGHAWIVSSTERTASPRLATNASGSWVTSPLPVNGEHASLALDVSGTPVVVLSTDTFNCSGCSDGAIVVETRSGPAWTTSVQSSNVLDGDPDLVIDAAGKAHLSLVRVYAGAPGVLYRTDRSGSWATTMAAPGENSQADLAVDGAGMAHLAYLHAVYPGKLEVWYATNESGSWQSTLVAAGTNDSPSVSVDAAGHAWVVWSDGSAKILYRTNVSGTWSAAAGVGSSPGTSPDSGIDAAGHLLVAYRDVATGKAILITNASGSWVRTAVGGVFPLDGYHPIRLVVDGSGKAHIAYSSDTGPRYVTNRSGSWVSSPATEIPGMVWSLAVDGAGRAHIGIRGNAQLADLTNASGAWVFRQAVAGDGPSIAVGPTGVTSIAYVANGVQLAHD